jgi:hypothetical protein
VEAPLTAPDALIRPWRTATIVASLIAAVELVALLVLGFALLAKPIAHALKHHAATSAKTSTTRHTAAKTPKLVVHKPPPAVAHLPRGKTGILVLNGNGQNGAAAAAAAHLHGLGYPVTATGNAPRSDYATTSVLYKPGFRGEAVRLEHDLGVHAVGPLDGLKASALHGGKLAVILGGG